MKDLLVPVLGDPNVKPSQSLPLPKDASYASKEEMASDPVLMEEKENEEKVHVYEVKLVDLPHKCVNCVKEVCDGVSKGDMSPFMDPINHEYFLVIAISIFIVSLFFKR
jgi:hypothetical protein